MNRYPLWKYLLVLCVLAIGVLYSAPNLFPPDPAIQISGESGGQSLSDELRSKAVAALENAGIAVKGSDAGDTSILLRLADKNQQLAARDVVHQALGDGYVVALNLADTTPAWLMAFGAQPMKLGLDLSGGVHFLLEVDTEFAVNQRLDAYKSEIRRLLREERIRGLVDDKPLLITGSFKDSASRDAAVSLINKEIPLLSVESLDSNGEFLANWSLGDVQRREIANDTVAKNLTALRNRVNELGVSEPLVQRQGANRIVVELPGIQDSAMAKRIIGKIASLEFRLEAGSDTPSETFPFREGGRRGQATLERTIVITGEQVSTASSSFDENGRPQVNITLDGQGGRQMHQATKNNIGRNLGVLFIERKQRTRTVVENGERKQLREPYFDKQVISLATIQSALGVQFRITGLNTPEEARELALLLRAGALTAPIDFVEERTIGPSLGEENIRLGSNAILYGMLLVVAFMLFYYKVFGLVANLALLMNVVLIVAVMSLFSATLTLPGIAGIVLTIGMAVDANVLIFARIREELKAGLSPQQAIHAGYDRAFVSILDANITTFLVAVILFAIGTGTVKGFAVTLMIGIVTSMFTAIMGTRALVNLIYGNRNIKQLAI